MHGVHNLIMVMMYMTHARKQADLQTHAEKQTGMQTGRQTCRQTYRHRVRQTQTHGQTCRDKHADAQTYTQTDIQIYKYSDSLTALCSLLRIPFLDKFPEARKDSGN